MSTGFETESETKEDRSCYVDVRLQQYLEREDTEPAERSNNENSVGHSEVG